MGMKTSDAGDSTTKSTRRPVTYGTGGWLLIVDGAAVGSRCLRVPETVTCFGKCSGSTFWSAISCTSPMSRKSQRIFCSWGWYHPSLSGSGFLPSISGDVYPPEEIPLDFQVIWWERHVLHRDVQFRRRNVLKAAISTASVCRFFKGAALFFIHFFILIQVYFFINFLVFRFGCAFPIYVLNIYLSSGEKCTLYPCGVSSFSWNIILE